MSAHNAPAQGDTGARHSAENDRSATVPIEVYDVGIALDVLTDLAVLTGNGSVPDKVARRLAAALGTPYPELNDGSTRSNNPHITTEEQA